MKELCLNKGWNLNMNIIGAWSQNSGFHLAGNPRIINISKTNMNINISGSKNRESDLTHRINDLSKTERTLVRTNTVSPPTPNGSFTPMKLPDWLINSGREQAKSAMIADRDAFYTPDKFLAEYKPGSFSVEDEIKLASQFGTHFVLDGKIVRSSSGEILTHSNGVIHVNQPSPLNFEQQINNLITLREHLGENADNYTAEFEKAVDSVIDHFLSRSGMYVNADSQGVADSIRAMFNGTDGKYTADDLKTMAVLSFERHSADARDSEIVVGMHLGLDALSIEMARKSGKLSDAAYATVKDSFAAHTEETIRNMNSYLEWAKKDAFMPKDVTYTPVRPDLVYKSIEVMLGALEDADFNRGLREAIKTLENTHNAQRDNQFLSKGIVDQRFSFSFMSSNDRERHGDNMDIKSGFFVEYLNRPEWAIKGNPFSFSVTV